MAIIPVSLLWRGTFGTTYGIGENFSERKTTPLQLSDSDGFLAGGIAFDLILDEEHNLVNEVTAHPVEKGAPITDHIRNRLREGKLTGMVSNYSLFSFALDNLESRSQKAYETMKELWRKEMPVDIVSVLEVYTNVAITSVNMTRDDTTGDRQNFQISFKEISIKKLESVDVSTSINVQDMDAGINQQAAPPVDVGRQIADDAAGGLAFG